MTFVCPYANLYASKLVSTVSPGLCMFSCSFMKMCLQIWIFNWIIFHDISTLLNLKFPYKKTCVCNSSWIPLGNFAGFHTIIWSVHLSLYFWFDHFWWHCSHFGLTWLMSATPTTSFFKLIWNFTGIFSMIWTCACDFGILVVIFLRELYPFLTLTFFQLIKNLA